MSCPVCVGGFAPGSVDGEVFCSGCGRLVAGAGHLAEALRRVEVRQARDARLVDLLDESNFCWPGDEYAADIRALLEEVRSLRRQDPT